MSSPQAKRWWQKQYRPCVVVSVPFLEFAGPMITSGVVIQSFEGLPPPFRSFDYWEGMKGEPVNFPYRRLTAESRGLRRLKGIVDGVEIFRGVPRLLVTHVDNDHRRQKKAVPEKWLPLVQPLGERPDVSNFAGGSILADHIEGLESILSADSVCHLLEGPNKVCSLLDTKNRVLSETKEWIPLRRLMPESPDGVIVLRDIVRLASEGAEAMQDTHCCEVFDSTEPGWPTTVLSGSLRFLRSWEDCESNVRIAVISPVEPSFPDALDFANCLFRQRAKRDLVPPPDLLECKPASIDAHFFLSP